MNSPQTIYALSSGALPAAIAIVRISGPLAKKALQLLGATNLTPRKLILTKLKPSKQEIIDMALVCFFSKEESITGEDLVELHLHGSLAVVDEVFLFLSSITGLRPAEPGEFTKRSLLNGKMGLIEVEGLADLIASETKEQRIQSLRLLKGELSKKYLKWGKELIRIRAEMEALLDFSDEGDVSQKANNNNLIKKMPNLINKIEKDLAKGAAGTRLRNGLKIALIGPPNVGKSSLINVLLKEERAIVSAHAGTTRDIIEARLDLEGAPVTVYDTAGIRIARNKIEKEGVKRSKSTAENADIILYIRSALDDPKEKALDLSKYKPSKIIHVYNKTDLLENKGQLKKEGFGVSCKTKQGIDIFLEFLCKEVRRLTSLSDMAIGPNRIRHMNHLKETKDSLELALIESKKGKMDVSADFIRSANVSLGRIVGTVDIEDVLDEIFLGFCIGK
jgi:tRNA modification GTPase